MTVNRKPAPPAQERGKDEKTTSHWRALFVDTIRPALIIIATSIASVFAYVVTPLNGMVNALVWREAALLQLVSHSNELTEGEVMSLDVFLQVRSQVPVSEGTLRVTYPRHLLRPLPETSARLTMTTPKVEHALRLTGTALEFVTQGVGTGEVSVELMTNAGHFRGSLPVSVLPRKQHTHPTRHDFTGRWHIDVGGIAGSMEIVETARYIRGEYSLSDGQRGQIEGSRDGSTFRANFYRGSAPSRYALEATFGADPHTELELSGTAHLLIPTGDANSPWRREAAGGFNAVAKVP
jgi:hypothetical protein